jgi:spermidine/putrescine-binding protein
MPSNAGTCYMPLRRTIIRGVAATGLGLAAPWFYIKAPRAADPKRLNAYNYDGVVGKFYADYWIKPFEEKFDVKIDTVQVSASLVPLDKLMAQIAAGRPESDYVPLQPTQMIVAVRNNALMKLGSDKLPAGNDWDSDYLSDYGPKAVPYAYGLAYDKEKVKKPPTSWKEMWSPEMKKQVSINDAAFEQALQMVNLTFKGNTTPVDAETFKHLDDLRPNIETLWTTGAQIEQLFRTREVTMAPCWNGRTYGLADQGVPVDFVVPDEGMLVRWNLQSVPRTALNPDLAIQFVNFTMEAAQQQKLIDLLSYASPNRKCTYTPEALRRTVLRVPENQKKAKFENYEVMVDEMGNWAKMWAQWKAA